MTLSSLALFLAQAPVPASDAREVATRFARQFLAPSPETGFITLGLVLLAGIAVQIVATWIAAKVVVGTEQATFARAAQLWLFGLLAGFGMIILLVICLGLAASAHQPMLLLLVGGGWLLLAFTLGLLLPAKVFETDLLRSLGILVLSSILILAAQTAFDQTLGRSTLAHWRPVQRMILDSPEGRQRRLRHLLHADPLASIESDLDRLASPEERAKPFGEREAGLRAIFTALEQRRKTIQAGDAETLAAHEAVRQRYEDLVKILRADYAAAQAPPR